MSQRSYRRGPTRHGEFARLNGPRLKDVQDNFKRIKLRKKIREREFKEAMKNLYDIDL